jgi:hypothetical protein
MRAPARRLLSALTGLTGFSSRAPLAARLCIVGLCIVGLVSGFACFSSKSTAGRAIIFKHDVGSFQVLLL